jgi:imidazole glycerol phosphate synthase subunit HisF
MYLKDIGDPSENAAAYSEVGADELVFQDITATVEKRKTIVDAVSLPVIASGGAGTLDHLYEAITVAHADSVLVASITHYGTYSIKQMKQYLADRGIPVRL